MKLKAFLIAVLLFLPAPSFAQGDEFPFTRSIVVNSPPEVTTWPITSSITSVRFSANGWVTDFDRRLGPNAWPNIIFPPEFADPLQYTLGLCRKLTPSWMCSFVVEFWQKRIEEEGPHSASAPNEISREWFYDSRWGGLAGWQPQVGEQVGVVIMACDGRNRAAAPAGCVPQRTNARLVTWGADVGGPVVTQPTEPSQPQQPQQPSEPTHPSQPTQGTLVPADHDQLERIFANLTAQNEDLRAKLAALDEHLTQHDNQPMWITKFAKSPLGIALMSAGSTCAASQCWQHLFGR